MRKDFVKNLFVGIFALTGACIQSAFSETSDDVIVIQSVGVGESPQDAAQNAAENALKDTVGSFIDSSTSVEKKTIIIGELKSQSKSIDAKTHEYSQGVIRSFHLKDTRFESGVYKVTAEVGVKPEEFKRAIYKAQEGVAQVESGLFVRHSTNVGQIENKLEMIRSLAGPLFSGQATQFDVGSPRPYLEMPFKGRSPALDELLRREGSEYLFVVEAQSQLNPDYVSNLTRTLKEISSGQAKTPRFRMAARAPCGNFSQTYNDRSDLLFRISDYGMTQNIRPLHEDNESAEVYLIKDARKLLDQPPFSNQNQIDAKLEVNVLAENGDTLQTEFFGKQSSGKIAVIKHQDATSDGPWVFARYTNFCNMGTHQGRGFHIAKKIRYTVYIALDKTTLSRAHKITMNITN